MSDHAKDSPAAAGEGLPVLELIDLFKRSAKRPLSARDIVAPLALDRSRRQALLALLHEWVAAGVLTQRPDGRFLLSRQIRLQSGILTVQRGGYGFVAVGEKQPDVFVPGRGLRDALDGDRVALAVTDRTGRFAGRPQGMILQVVERARREILGRYVPGERFGRLLPLAPKFAPPVLLAAQEPHGLLPDQVVIARIESWSEKERALLATVVAVLGESADPAVDVQVIAWKHQLPTTFPAAVAAAAAKVPPGVGPEDLPGRVDLRELPLVTIDGETARDFDDAVAVRSESDGGYRLWVAIADVGHYVPEGGIIDLEARSRGTSVYFPDRCLPMLPEELSNGICSLNPGVERLAFVAELSFAANGTRREARFYPAVIRSQARLTYTEVFARLAEAPPFEGDNPELTGRLREMATLATRLTAMRVARGSIDFDLPEAEVVLGLRGKPENIVRRERNSAHRLIEEFMLAANEAVAAELVRRKLPCLFRIHEPPDREKMEALQEFVAHFNYGLPLEPPARLPRALQELLAESAGKAEERPIHQLMLRSMQQARYAAENVGHFGLAAEMYCHFTSPIRRYPDLMVHRVLRHALQADPADERVVSSWRRSFAALGESLSALERRAMEAEREMLSLCKCRFMQEKVGEEFSGLVSGVHSSGLFVELDEWLVEGMVAIASLGDDYYEFDPQRLELVGQRRRRVFRIGDAVRVRVVRVNLDWREIDFALAGGEEPPRVSRRKTPSRPLRGRRR